LILMRYRNRLVIKTRPIHEKNLALPSHAQTLALLTLDQASLLLDAQTFNFW